MNPRTTITSLDGCLHLFRISYSSQHQPAWIFQDDIFPVCSPAFAARHHLLELSANEISDVIRTLPLLGETHSQTPDTWQEWGANFGVYIPETNVQRYQQSNMALLLAEHSQGLAMGRTCLVSDAIRTGTLVEVGSFKTLSTAGYLVSHNPSRAPTESALKFAEWIKTEIGNVGEN